MCSDNNSESNTAMVQIPPASFLDPRLPASSMSQASHIPPLKHTTMYMQQTRHNTCLYVQCVGISWQSYLLFASYLMNSIFQCILLTFCVVDPEVQDIGHGDYPVDFVSPSVTYNPRHAVFTTVDVHFPFKDLLSQLISVPSRCIVFT